MNSEKLMQHIGNVDDGIVMESERDMPRQKRVGWLSGIAAVITMAMAVYFANIIVNNLQPSAPSSTLPILSMQNVAEMAFGWGGMTPLRATDVSQIIGNPPDISNMQLDTLPVFRSPMYHLGHWSEFAIDTRQTDQMLVEIERIAATFGLSMEDAHDITFLTVQDRLGSFREIAYYSDWVLSATGHWDNIRIQASNTNLPHNISIHFSNLNDFPMPPGFTNSFEWEFAAHDITNQQTFEMAEFFLQYFAAAIGFTSPTVDITHSSYSLDIDEDGTVTGFVRHFMWNSFGAYDMGNCYVSAILGYNFNRVYFVPGRDFENDPRVHTMVYITRPDFMLSHKIGNYPVISLEEATQLLLAGQYISAVDIEHLGYPCKERIARVDIVYLTHWQDIFMPFYRFTVELYIPWWDYELYTKHEMRTFGWFFVPAVNGEFLEGF